MSIIVHDAAVISRCVLPIHRDEETQRRLRDVTLCVALRERAVDRRRSRSSAR